MRTTFDGQPEACVTEQAAVRSGAPTRMTRSPRTALIRAAAGLAVSAAVAGVLLAYLLVPLPELPRFMFSEQWRTVLVFAGLIAGLLWLLGLSAGLALLSARRRRGERRPALLSLALSLASVVVLAVPLIWGGLPPYVPYAFWSGASYAYYRVHELPAAERARLDALSTEAVVRTYFATDDPSVMYWLGSAERRGWWHEGNVVLDLETLAGVSDLEVAPGAYTAPGEDTTTFRVTYTSRIANSIG